MEFLDSKNLWSHNVEKQDSNGLNKWNNNQYKTGEYTEIPGTDSGTL